MTIIIALRTDAESVAMVELGASDSSKTWVYLCGLTEHINSEQEVENRSILDTLGKRLNLRFLAIHPFYRCGRVNYKLCWPHYTPEQTLDVFDTILTVVRDEQISGYIGFSNGGFFLNQLSQMKELSLPIITIGAAGSYFEPSVSNNLTIIVGKLEPIYGSARALYRNAKNSPLSVTFIEHDGSHIIPSNTLEKLMRESHS
ncbi:MAG: hypothetical protein JSR85_03250 [Proteobacteria bacterium]|nr:hypothetical protein [Pseudomonadota bacterium]